MGEASQAALAAQTADGSGGCEPEVEEGEPEQLTVDLATLRAHGVYEGFYVCPGAQPAPSAPLRSDDPESMFCVSWRSAGGEVWVADTAAGESILPRFLNPPYWLSFAQFSLATHTGNVANSGARVRPPFVPALRPPSTLCVSIIGGQLLIPLLPQTSRGLELFLGRRRTIWAAGPSAARTTDPSTGDRFFMPSALFSSS